MQNKINPHLQDLKTQFRNTNIQKQKNQYTKSKIQKYKIQTKINIQLQTFKKNKFNN